MEPVLSVTVGAVLAMALTNIAWWRTTRSLRRGQRSLAMAAELQKTKARVVGLHLQLVDAVRPMLSAKETVPSESSAVITRMVKAHRETRNEARELRSELGSVRRRVAQGQRELALLRQGTATKPIRDHLAQVSSERDALQEKVADLAERVRKSSPTNTDSLHAARQEINRLREQLRSANHAIATLNVAPMGSPLPLADEHIWADLADEPTDPNQVDHSRPPVSSTPRNDEWR